MMSKPIPAGQEGLIPHLLCSPKSFLLLADDFPAFCGGKSSKATALQGTPATIHHYVENCDAAIKRAQVIMPAADMFWGDRYGSDRSLRP
jgi:PhnB protein